MKKIVALLVLLSFNLHAQFSFFNFNYADCTENSFQEQLGINLSVPHEGSFKKVKDQLNSEYYKNHKIEAFYIESLLNYNTLGKIKTHQIISQSVLSSEDKDFLKVWLSYYSKNSDDYKKLSQDFKKKYKNNLNLSKLELRKNLVDIQKFFNSKREERENGLLCVDSILQTKLNTDDRLYFSLLKLDFQNFDKDYVKNDVLKFYAFKKLWSQSKDRMNYIAVSRMVKRCEKDCDDIENWIAEQQNAERKFKGAEQVYLLILKQSKSENPSVQELQNDIHGIFNKETSENQKDQIKGLVTSCALEKVPNLGLFMNNYNSKIKFEPSFIEKFSLQCTKENCFEKFKELGDFFVKTIDKNKINEMYNKLKKYSLDDIKAGYGLLVYVNYMNSMMKSGFEDELGMYTDHKPNEFYYETSVMLSYLSENPLYFEERDYTFDKSYSEIKTKEDLLKLNLEMDKLVQKYPGSLGIRMKQITLKDHFKKLIPQTELQNFYFDYFTNIIEFYSINQKWDFREFESLFFDSYSQEGKFGSWNPFQNFYRKLSKDSINKINKFLDQKIKEFPVSQNIKSIASRIEKEEKEKSENN